ncbi:unnamed protein product [Effrenium voratum]|nr:unnamed protein product [Effrenium voratum]
MTKKVCREHVRHWGRNLGGCCSVIKVETYSRNRRSRRVIVSIVSDLSTTAHRHIMAPGRDDAQRRIALAFGAESLEPSPALLGRFRRFRRLREASQRGGWREEKGAPVPRWNLREPGLTSRVFVWAVVGE